MLFKNTFIFLVPLILTVHINGQTVDPYKNYPVYNGKDLGVSYTAAKTTCKVWAPTATEVIMKLYKTGEGGKWTKAIQLKKENNGVWTANITGNVKNNYYTFQVKDNGKYLNDAPDIYAKAVGVNGKRGMIVDLKATNPAQWDKDKKPLLNQFTDAIIYEMQVRDISINKNSGIKYKGKFLGLAEANTSTPTGEKTGLAHLKELGVTHLHILPAFDFNSIDETKPNEKYNWGYDPLNYNVPEGSFSTNPYDGNVRIKEFKKMVQTLHKSGIRVILDVVYNHTSNRESYFNQFAPGYYYRHNDKGDYSDATGCGNETASERAMMRKFMIESACFWAKEYHIDGFRFDLMGVHDIETMNQISEALHKIDSTIFIYGEGWTAGNSPLSEDLRAVKKNTLKLNKIAAFSDDIRDGLRGPYNDVKVKGFISGEPGTAESVKFGIVASTQHPQINYNLVNYSKAPWANEPYQTITYVSCHDDNNLYDRLAIDNPDATESAIIQMDKLSQAIVLTSQGVAFLHEGEEMLRTKKRIANSYNQPDSINEMDWSRKAKYKDVFNYYKGLIALRKNHPAFRMPSTKMIQEHLNFLETNDPQVIAYQISDHANGDKWKDILVVINGKPQSKTIQIPEGKWTLVADEKIINEKGIMQIKGGGQLEMPGTAEWVLWK